mgnify:CR=1 FL=1
MVVVLEEMFQVILVGIAEDLKLEIVKTRAGFFLSKGDVSAGFMTFVDREGKLRITMMIRGSPTQRPRDLGNFTKEELSGKDSKVRKVILANISEFFV